MYYFVAEIALRFITKYYYEVPTELFTLKKIFFLQIAMMSVVIIFSRKKFMDEYYHTLLCWFIVMHYLFSSTINMLRLLCV